jgi:outer membrane autotransporter protein
MKVNDTGDLVVSVKNDPANSASITDNVAAAAMIHSPTTARNAVAQHLLPAQFLNNNTANNSVRGQCVPLSRNVWMNYAGRFDKFRSNYGGNDNGDWKLNRNGLQAGTDFFRSTQNQIGMIFGFEGGKASLAQSEIKSDDFYLGLYAAHLFNNGFDIQCVYNFGWQN